MNNLADILQFIRLHFGRALVLFPLVCALVPMAFILLAQWLAVARYGSDAFLWLAVLLGFPFLAFLLLFIPALIGLPFRRTRRIAMVVMLCAVAYCGSFVAAIRLGQPIRMRAFARLAERSKPLVAAIRQYEQKNGRAPESLSALVPQYLPSVPSTGMRAYPDYEYISPGTNYQGNPWVLVIFTPSGGMNFDQFMYFPLTNYPQNGYGGWLERVGDWAYVHE